MKRIYLLLLTLLLSFNVFAQSTYQIGSGTSTTSYFPLYYNWEYNYNQTIYTVAELNAQGATVGGQITKIKYKPTSSVSTADWQDWVVYMGNTTKTDFSSDSDWVAVSSMTQVFNGQIIANTTANNWIEITLTTPFTWDGISNIIVAIDENTPDYGNSPSWSGYTLAPASGKKGLYKYRDTTDIDPLNPPTGTRTNTVAQIQFIGNLTPPCTGTPLGGTVSSATQVGCNTTAVSVVPVNPGFPAFTYQWQESDDNGVADPWSDVVGATGLSFTPPPITGTTDKYYRLKTTCSGTGQSAYSDVHTVTIPATPNPATGMTFTNVTDNSLTINWTNGNGDRRVLLANTTNNFSSLPTTGVAYTNGTLLSGGDLLIWDGTADNIDIIGLECNTTYYFRLYEYKRCGTSPNYAFVHAAQLDGNTTTANYVPTMATLPATNNFSGFTGTNLSAVFPGWEEKKGDTPAGTTSTWTDSNDLSLPTAKVNLYTDDRKEWIISPTVHIDSISRVRFKAAITNYASGSADSDGMQGTDDKVQVMISSDACGGLSWTPLYTFDASTTVNLTNVLTDYEIIIPSQYISEDIRIGFKATDGPTNDSPDYDFHITNVVIENIPPPAIAMTKMDILCSGGTGSATATVTEGVLPLTYSWSPSGGTSETATGLAAGTYTFTVTDAINRTTTETVTITEPTAIVSNLITTNISCNGVNDGSITIAPTGGVAPYTYLWNTNDTGTALTNLSPDTYSVTITDANGCTLVEDITITEPDVLDATGTQTDVSTYLGSDGEVVLTVTGGTTPYTYAWSPSGGTGDTASNLTAGTYTVLVTDANGCTTTEVFTITQPIPLMFQSVSKTNVKCNGGSDGTATVSVIGGNAPYTYLWTPTGGTNETATGLSAGTYTVEITDATPVTITHTFTITEPGVIVPTISNKKDVLCNGAKNGSATVTVTGGIAPFTYIWSNGTTTTNATVNNLDVGTYTVMITDANGCSSVTPATVTITQPAAIVINSANTTNVSCYGQNDGSVTVSVSGGVGPYTYIWSNGQSGTTISNLTKGNYTVTVTDVNNCSKTQSFTITEPPFVNTPVANNPNFCTGQNAKLSDIVISGSNIKWYDAATGGNILPATTALVNGTTYYATQTVGTCESARTPIKVNISQTTPLTTTQLSVCSNTRIQNMTIDGFNYTQLKWYSSATSTTPLASSQLLATQTYYISSVTGTCESSRQAIQVTVAATVPAPTASAQTVCSNTTLNDLVVTKDPNATLNWYSSTQSMIPLANTTVVASGTYYVQQVIGNCESPRVAVAVQVNNVTTPTIASITICEGITIADFNLIGSTNYIWYTDNSTTTALPDTYVITSGTYYIANELAGCISARKNVAVNVSTRPVSPTGQATQTFGPTKTVSDIKMDQSNVSWFASYDDAVKQINEIAKTTQLQDQTTYYGILTNANGCGSMPTAVLIKIDLGVQELDLAQLSYYPNPADSELNISYIEDINNVEIFTITGQKVLSKEFKSREVKVDLSGLSAGTYMVRIQTEKASQFIKIIKK